MKTLAQILTDANATLDLEAALPTGDELTLRTNYANQSVYDAAVNNILPEFKGVYTQTVSGATLSLPSNFRELEVIPYIYNGASWIDYPLIDPEDIYEKSSSERYSYVLGNPQGGYNLIFNGQVEGTASIVYQRYPSGMNTLTSICELSDPTYVTRKIESYVLYSRGDDRLTIAEQRAQQALSNMVGAKMKGSGGLPKSTKMNFTNPLT